MAVRLQALPISLKGKREPSGQGPQAREYPSIRNLEKFINFRKKSI